MNAIAEELDRRMRTLDPQRAAQCELLVRKILDSLPEAKPVSPPPNAGLRFITLTKDLGLRPGIDPTKLGQLVDDL